jgi:hypothetical protein
LLVPSFRLLSRDYSSSRTLLGGFSFAPLLRRDAQKLPFEDSPLHICSLPLDQRLFQLTRGGVLFVFADALSTFFRRRLFLLIALRLNRGLCVVMFRLLDCPKSLTFCFGNLRCIDVCEGCEYGEYGEARSSLYLQERLTIYTVSSKFELSI